MAPRTQNQGKKRARTTSTPDPHETPTCAQRPPPSTSPTSGMSQPIPPTSGESAQQSKNTTKKSKQRTPHLLPAEKKQKMPQLPSSARISKRPLHRPAIPTPHTSATSPKVLYLKASSPYVPAIKRVRSLLSEIQKRRAQSDKALLGNLRSNGRLSHQAVERAIAEGSAGAGGKKKEVEWVYMKASGRAIPRALEIGVHFQGEKDCRVKVQMGSVKAVDDIEVDASVPDEGAGVDEEGNVEMRDADQEVEDGKSQEKPPKKKEMVQEDIPETRVRNLSVVSVAICLV